MIYALYDMMSGELLFLTPDRPTDTFSNIPAGVVELDAMPDMEMVDWSAELRTFIPAIARIEAALLAEIDATANGLIEERVTPGAGIQAIREYKARELERWDAEGDGREVTAEHYPFVVAEASAKGVSPAVIIDSIRIEVARWIGAAPTLEAVRTAGKDAVRAAVVVPAKQAAAASVLALLEGLRNA